MNGANRHEERKKVKRINHDPQILLISVMAREGWANHQGRKRAKRVK